MRQFEVNIQN